MTVAVGRAALLAALAIAVAGCHTMRFEVEEPTGNVRAVTEHKSFFFWGLVPTREVSVIERCPGGVQSIQEQTSFVDGLAELFTIGIWAPRSTTFYCLEGGQP